MEQQTVVEWLAEIIRFANKELYAEMFEEIKQAKQMEKEQKIKAQIEILREIGNNGMNAPLYGILKDKLIILEEQLTKL